MDTIIFVKDRNWPGTNSRIYEISSADLGRKAMTSWSRIEDMQAAGYSLPGEALQNRYFALSNRDDATQAEWDEFIDALWNVVHSMTSEALADWFIQLNDPVTVKAHCWVHDGVEYLDAAHTLPRDEASR